MTGEPVRVEVNPESFAEEMPPPRPNELALEAVVKEEAEAPSIEAIDPDAALLRASQSSLAAA